MAEPSTDDKIARLVHSVLEAVDLRLSEVRQDIQAMTAEVDRRHADVQQQLDDLGRRMDRLAADAASAKAGGSSDEQLAARMEQATQVVLERLESTQRRHTAATDEHLARIDAALATLRAQPPVQPAAQPLTGETPTPTLAITPTAPTAAPAPVAPPVATPAPALQPLTPSLPSFGQVSAPLLPTHAPAPAAAPPHTGEHPVLPDGEQIDLDQLTDLLTARLGQLNLPRAD